MLGIRSDCRPPARIHCAGEGWLFYEWRGPDCAKIGEEADLKEVAEMAKHWAAQRMPGVKIERDHSLPEQTGRRVALTGGQKAQIGRAEQSAVGTQLDGEPARGESQTLARRDDLTVDIVEAILEFAVIEGSASRIIADDKVIAGKVRGFGALPSGKNKFALRPHRARADERTIGELFFGRTIGVPNHGTLHHHTNIRAGIQQSVESHISSPRGDGTRRFAERVSGHLGCRNHACRCHRTG